MEIYWNIWGQKGRFMTDIVRHRVNPLRMAAEWKHIRSNNGRDIVVILDKYCIYWKVNIYWRLNGNTLESRNVLPKTAKF